MKISYNWLKNYIDLDPSSTRPKVWLRCFRLLGFDIEEYEKLGPPQLENVVVGQVVEYDQHPNADRLRCLQVNTGPRGRGEPHKIVCGAKNFDAGDKVMVALPGAVLPGDFKIKASKLRGQPSEGMMCSAKELQIGQDHDGIMILDPETDLGTPLNDLFKDGDTVFDLEITPNRVDVLSHIGVARELSARFGMPVKYPEVKASTENAIDGEPSDLRCRGECYGGLPALHRTLHQGRESRPEPQMAQRRHRGDRATLDQQRRRRDELRAPRDLPAAPRLRRGQDQGRSTRRPHGGEGEKITTLDEVERTLSQRWP